MQRPRADGPADRQSHAARPGAPGPAPARRPAEGPNAHHAARTVTATGTIPRVRLPDSDHGHPATHARASESAPDALHHEYVGDWGYRPGVPEPIGRGTRMYVMIVFWLMLVVSVELWWLDTPGHSLSGTGAMLTEGGRITGMVAGFLLLAQVLLMSRARWLERWIGAHDLLHWHRDLGAALTILVVAHVALITFGYASQTGVSIFAADRHALAAPSTT